MPLLLVEWLLVHDRHRRQQTGQAVAAAQKLAAGSPFLVPTPVCPKRSANSFSSVCAIMLRAAALRSRAVSMSWLVDCRSVPYWWWCAMAG